MSLEIVLTNVQLLLARPEMADMRKIHHYAAERGAHIEEVSYIVKLYTENLPVDSLGVELYVGSQQIRKYSQFKNGVYFKVNDPQQLSALEGQEIRFRRPGSEEFANTGVRVPAQETLIRRLSTADPSQLPTQAEVLQE
jgi:hypothetical protein